MKFNPSASMFQSGHYSTIKLTGGYSVGGVGGSGGDGIGSNTGFTDTGGTTGTTGTTGGESTNF
jgi:hypothetical protein